MGEEEAVIFRTGRWREQSSDGRGGRSSGRGAGGGGRNGRSIDTRRFTLDPDHIGLPTRPGVATFPPSVAAAASAAAPPPASLSRPSTVAAAATTTTPMTVTTIATTTAAMADGFPASAAASFSLDGSAGIVGSDGIEYDSLSHRVQMILLMDKNASSASNESLSASFVKKLYEDVMSKRDAIISMVVAEKPELEIMITDALDAPFNVQGKQRPGKVHRVEKLVDIWEFYEQVPSLKKGLLGRGRSNSLLDFSQTMNRYHQLAKTAVAENRNKLRGWKSEPMSDEERERRYLMGGGIDLKPQYPWCARCKHPFLDGPPENATVDEQNQEDVSNYMQLCEEVKAWKNDKANVEQPRCSTTLELIEKMPSAPKPRKKFGHCHCHHFKANGRDRVHGTCPIGCFYEGVQYAFSQCPICLCTCDAFIDLGQYHAIVAVSTVTTSQTRNADTRANAMEWLESGMNVNREQRRTSAEFYANAMQNGSLAGDANVALNIDNEAALAQSLYMVGNATFDHGTLRALRAKVDGVQHPAGSTFTQHGDLNQHGRTTAADRRNTNNRLRGAEGEMTEEEMVSEAIARSLREPLQVLPYLRSTAPGLLPRNQMPSQYSTSSASYASSIQNTNPMKTPVTQMQGIEGTVALEADVTPAFIVNTRKHLIVSRRKNRNNMSDDDKRKHAKVIDGLSRPYNNTLLNVLKSVEEEPTPEKAEELLSMAEDLEGVHLGK